MGLTNGIIQPVYAGRPCYLMPAVAFLMRPVRWLQAISRYKATISGGPNFAYDLCVRRYSESAARDLDLSSWTVAYNGAEPVHAETIKRFIETFAGHGFGKVIVGFARNAAAKDVDAMAARMLTFLLPSRGRAR